MDIIYLQNIGRLVASCKW